MNILIALLLFSSADSSITQAEVEDTFIVSVKKRLIDEYRTCTGDSVNIRPDSLVRWKKNMTARTETPEYKKILEEFISHNGMASGAYPCEVLAWHRDRLQYLKTGEEAVVKKLISTLDNTVDSIRVFRELEANPPSPLDFEGIPFGLSKKVFALIFNKKFSFPLQDKNSVLSAEHVYLKGTPFLIRFHFSDKGRYYKYEIEGYSFHGDSLNSIVRPQATLLRQLMEEKIGPPARIERIGYFDIKSETISPYVKWEKETHSVTVGLGLEKNRYYTRATVVCK